MSRRRQEQLIGLLVRDEGWMPSTALADRLGVTPRSVRSYIAAINAEAEGAVESGPAGYRADRSVLAGLRAKDSRPKTAPRDRLHALVRELLEASSGVDLYRAAERLHVSEATLEADLVRVRSLLHGTGLALKRSGPRLLLVGGELEQRRLVSTLAHAEMEHGYFDVEGMRRGAGIGAVDSSAFGPFKSELAAELAEQGYYVNEFATADVVLHVAIAAERVSQGRAVEGTPVEPAEQQERIAQLLGRLSSRHFGVTLGRGDLNHLASLVLTRVVAPGGDPSTQIALDPSVEAAVAEAVQRAAREYMVDIDHAVFVRRLSLHVQNLAHRAREQAWSRNPLTRSLKTAYPMIFQVAVSISDELSQVLEIPLRDDEIAYIAMHVGGQLERSRRAGEALTATIVSPGYYEMHELLRARIDKSLGSGIEVTRMETRVDPDWSSIDTDLVLTTIEPPTPDERTVHLPPFLTDQDMERISAAAGRRRRARRLARLRGELESYLDPSAFLRPLKAADEEDAIRQLAAPLRERGVIDQDYIERTIEREQLSSTAFTESLAVPHALKMTGTTTAVSLGIAEGSLPWGEGRVQVVALVAFSEEERSAFQTIFEQLVEVFNEPDSVQRLLRRGTDFASFLDELVAIIDG